MREIRPSGLEGGVGASPSLPLYDLADIRLLHQPGSALDRPPANKLRISLSRFDKCPMVNPVDVAISAVENGQNHGPKSPIRIRVPKQAQHGTRPQRSCHAH